MSHSPTTARFHGARRARGLILIVMLAAGLSGCISRAELPAVPHVTPDADVSLPKTAILLFANETNTVDAPEIFRPLLFKEMARRGFNLQPLQDTEDLLRDQLGISDGGQLPSATPQEIGLALGVDQLFFGDVLEWKKITTGVYNTVSIKATFKLVESRTGAVLWERTHEVRKHIEFKSGDNIGADILAGAIVNLFLNPMTPYAKQLAREVGRQLPDARRGIPPAEIPREKIPTDEIPQGDIR